MGFWGIGEQGHFSGEQGNKGLKIRGTGEHRQFCGTGNIENQDFVFGEQGNKTIFFFEGTREQIPPPPWEGLNKGADQPARMRSLISAFAVDFLDSIIIPILALFKFSRL